MSVAALRALLFVGGIGAAAGLPVAGRALRAVDDAGRCALDGIAIAAGAAVEVADESGRNRSFCCVDCAQDWIDRSGVEPRAIVVTDETTGADLDASDAWFVRSRVPSQAGCGSYVHVFATEADALGHVDAFGGIVLAGAERPLRGRE